MFADYRPIRDLVARPSVNITLTETLYSVKNSVTVDVVVMATDSARWRNVNRSACNAPS